ncbi:MAG TPA: hypothetical protein VH253_05205 [Phycisphaerae bacterium]|nr:hypothetical protein [Phycisphaerae bacterium]
MRVGIRAVGAFVMVLAIGGGMDTGGVVRDARAADVAAETTLQRTLDQPFNLTLTKVQLSEAFKQIASTAKISLQVDPACYDLLPYGATTIVSADFRQSKLRDAIEEVLVPLGLQQEVSGTTVMIRPSAPLAHIGRRAYWEELKLLQDLRNSEIKPAADGSFDWKTALRTALDRPELVTVIADEGVSAPVREKAIEQVKGQLPLSAFRALQIYAQLTNQIWFVECAPGPGGAGGGGGAPGAGGTIRVMNMKAWMQRQLERPIQVDFTNAPLSEVVGELTHLSGIRFVPEPGLYQMVPVVSLKSNNGSVLQTLEALAGGTRIAFEVREDSILLHLGGETAGGAAEPVKSSGGASGGGDAIVARISVPVGNGADKSMMEVFIHESDLPPELNEVRKRKIQEAIDGMERSWEGGEAKGGSPAPAVPATAPAATQPGTQTGGHAG